MGDVLERGRPRTVSQPSSTSVGPALIDGLATVTSRTVFRFSESVFVGFKNFKVLAAVEGVLVAEVVGAEVVGEELAVQVVEEMTAGSIRLSDV